MDSKTILAMIYLLIISVSSFGVGINIINRDKAWTGWAVSVCGWIAALILLYQ
jgi:hypothetical protein